jgi:hypothetical protein
VGEMTQAFYAHMNNKTIKNNKKNKESNQREDCCKGPLRERERKRARKKQYSTDRHLGGRLACIPNRAQDSLCLGIHSTLLQGIQKISGWRKRNIFQVLL